MTHTHYTNTTELFFASRIIIGHLSPGRRGTKNNHLITVDRTFKPKDNTFVLNVFTPSKLHMKPTMAALCYCSTATLTGLESSASDCGTLQQWLEIKMNTSVLLYFTQVKTDCRTFYILLVCHLSVHCYNGHMDLSGTVTDTDGPSTHAIPFQFHPIIFSCWKLRAQYCREHHSCHFPE